MAKPIIILADTDEDYLAPLEIKFLEELNDKIELEIITEQSYFNEHFSKPQNAEILVVSEDLYSNELQKQNISNIFVLTESVDEGGTEALDIKKIFKYTNTKEIYNQVTATSSGTINAEASKTRETIVALFYSAAGGVGKTTLSMAVSKCLAKNYKKVLYINAERLNSFHFLIDNKASIPNSVYGELSKIDSTLFARIKHIIRNEQFDYLPPFTSSLSALNIDYSIYEEIIKSAKATKNYDVIVVDLECAFDSKIASLISIANKVFVMTEQTRASECATNVLVRNMNFHDAEKYIFICNKFDANRFNALNEPSIKSNFSVNEYVKKIEKIDEKGINELANEPEVQKISFLIV